MRLGCNETPCFRTWRKRCPAVDRTIARILAHLHVLRGLPIPAAHAELVATDRVEITQPARRSGARAPGIASRQGGRARRARESRRERRGRKGPRRRLERRAKSSGSPQNSIRCPRAAADSRAVLWFALLVFVILLITDILGFTKVFPFTRPAK